MNTIEEVEETQRQLREMFPELDVSVNLNATAYFQKCGYPHGRETPSETLYWYSTIRVEKEGSPPFTEFGGRNVSLSEAMAQVRAWKESQQS